MFSWATEVKEGKSKKVLITSVQIASMGVILAKATTVMLIIIGR